MNQSSVRQNFIRNNPGIKLPGKAGYWYRCARCGRWCGRPGRSGVYIPEDIRMEVDHIVPWSKGGSDKLYNLQPMCRRCNRDKSNNETYGDMGKAFVNSIFHPVDSLILGKMRAEERKFGRKHKILRDIFGIGKRE